eukprot:PITA_32225
MESGMPEAMVGNHCSVGYVVRIIIRGLFHSIRVVVGPISIVRRRCIHLVMLAISFLGSMQLWTRGRWIIRHRSLRWTLYIHKTRAEWFDKAIECVDDSGEKRILEGKKKPTTMRMVTAMQAKRSCRKGCVMFVVHISSDKGKEVKDADVLSRYPVLRQFQDIFPKDITKFPPHREVDFPHELVPRAAPASKSPYRMSTTKLVELKL